MNQRPRKRMKPMSDINVVPYIDVMLVLLIVFMITAPLMTQGINVELPKVISDPMFLKNNEPLLVSIGKKGKYYLELGGKRNSASSLEEVEKAVKIILKRKPKTPVLVNGDRRVPYGAVIELLNALQKANVPNVGLLTEPPE